MSSKLPTLSLPYPIGRWIEIDPLVILSGDLPRRPACYAFYLDGKLVYIGSTENLRARFSAWYQPILDSKRVPLTNGICPNMYCDTYHTAWGDSEDFRIKVKFPRRFGEWLMIEARLLHRLKPRGNRRGTKRSNRLLAALVMTNG